MLTHSKHVAEKHPDAVHRREGPRVDDPGPDQQRGRGKQPETGVLSPEDERKRADHSEDTPHEEAERPQFLDAIRRGGISSIESELVTPVFPFDPGFCSDFASTQFSRTRRSISVGADHIHFDPFRRGLVRDTPADGAARVPGGRLDPQPFVRCLPQDAPVAHAVQCDTAGEAKVVSAGLAVQSASQPQHHFLRDVLNGPRQVHLASREGRFRFPRGPPEDGVEHIVGHARLASSAHRTIGSMLRPSSAAVTDGSFTSAESVGFVASTSDRWRGAGPPRTGDRTRNGGVTRNHRSTADVTGATNTTSRTGALGGAERASGDYVNR